MTNQQLKAHCEYVIANPQDHLDWVVDMAKEALAALTQPASPALKLPDGWVAVPLEPSREMRLASKRYKSKTKLPTGPGVYKAMVAAAPAAPHTAPIEPICATDGAGWVKVPRELTAENGAKYVLSAEFFVGHTITCHECAGDGCEGCGEKGQWEETIMIDWPTIKEIWRRGINHFCSHSDSNT